MHYQCQARNGAQDKPTSSLSLIADIGSDRYLGSPISHYLRVISDLGSGCYSYSGSGSPISHTMCVEWRFLSITLDVHLWTVLSSVPLSVLLLVLPAAGEVLPPHIEYQSKRQSQLKRCNLVMMSRSMCHRSLGSLAVTRCVHGQYPLEQEGRDGWKMKKSLQSISWTPLWHSSQMQRTSQVTKFSSRWTQDLGGWTCNSLQSWGCWDLFCIPTSPTLYMWHRRRTRSMVPSWPSS